MNQHGRQTRFGDWLIMFIPSGLNLVMDFTCCLEDQEQSAQVKMILSIPKIISRDVSISRATKASPVSNSLIPSIPETCQSQNAKGVKQLQDVFFVCRIEPARIRADDEHSSRRSITDGNHDFM